MPWATVRDNVRLPLKLAHAPARDADARIAAALDQSGSRNSRTPIRANCPAA